MTKSPMHIGIYLRAAKSCRDLRQGGVIARAVGRYLGLLARIYGLVVLGMDVPIRALVHHAVIVPHSVGIVIHADAVIEAGVILRQGVTIGEKSPGGGAPVLRAGASIGPNSTLLGAIEVGSGAVIGAGSVLTRSVGPHEVWAGVPAKRLGVRE